MPKVRFSAGKDFYFFNTVSKLALGAPQTFPRGKATGA
jgi:hypothetical protein